MDIQEMKRIKRLLFQVINENDSSLIEQYLADKIVWR